MVELIKYNSACKALAEAKSMDEVKDIRDKAEALRAYGRMAGNRQLEIDAAEIRFRAERRVGEIMAETRANGTRAGVGRHISPGGANNQTLAESGINRHMADRARRLAAVPTREFERQVSDWREDIERSHDRVTSSLVNRGVSRETRREAVVSHQRSYDRRVKHFLEKTKEYHKEVQAAINCSDKFSPEASAFALRKLEDLTRLIKDLKEELTS